MKIYLDSCIAIYLIEGLLPLKADTQKLVNSFGPKPEMVITDLTRLECLVHPIKTKREELITTYHRFFRLEEVTTVPLTSECFDKAADIRAHYSVSTPDALHLAAAIIDGCEVFLTNDRRLAEAAADLIKVVLPGFPET